MKSIKLIFALVTAAVVTGFFARIPLLQAQGFTESHVLFYGEVRKSGGGQTVLLQGGHLKVTFVNQSNPANRVNLETNLRPVGTGAARPYSYSMKVPLAFLPATPRIGQFLAVTTLPTQFRIEQITIDGTPATLPDGSKEFYGLNFASRSSQFRLDLLVAGSSTSSAHDGLPDWWKQIYGLDVAVDVSGEDPDGDGWSNLEEFRRGTDPTKSNRTPQLFTAEILVPESGEAGVILQLLDSDTPDSGLHVVLPSQSGNGFQLKYDGAPLVGATEVTLAEVKAGRLSIAHLDRAVRQSSLPLNWNDGGAPFSGEVLVRTVTPSAADGSDAALWLDGFDLPLAGSRVVSWPDRSGNGRAASQPLPDYQPVVANYSADFSTSPSAHLFFQDSALPAGDHTVFASYTAAASSDNAQTLLSTNRGYLQLTPTSQAISYPGAPTYQVDGSAVRGYGKTTGVTTTSIFRRQSSLLQNILGLSYDGENFAVETIDPVLPTLGGRRSAFPNGPDVIDNKFLGQIHEVLVFPGALAEQKLRSVNDYLQSKWNAAVIWDVSTSLKAVTLATAGIGARRNIIRGGFGDDVLTGGPGDDIISGGDGADVLTGGGGSNTFVFGGVDTGRKQITDFNPQKDIIDFSALYWGMTGDARAQISVRLDTNYSTPVPTLDSVLVVLRPGNGTQEVVLQNTVIGATQLIQLIVEGHIRMGSLNIPTSVQLALVAGGSPNPLGESLDQFFNVNVTRSGAGVSAALDVPVGFFVDALGGRFVVDGTSSTEGLRGVVNFPRGVTSRTITVHPVPDLDTTGLRTLQLAALPNFRYSIGGSSVQQTITDKPKIWLEVTQANAAATPAQPGRVVLHRDGSLTESLVINLQLGGTAVNGVHVVTLPSSLTIPIGQSTRELQISARAAGLSAGPKVLLVLLASQTRYLVGNPHEAVIYVGNTLQEANGAGFDRWLLASTNGAITGRSALASADPALVRDYIQAYAFGLQSVQQLAGKRLTLNLVAGRPELSVPGVLNAADLRWSVEASANIVQWSDVGSSFTQTPQTGGLKLTGQPLASNESAKSYRLSMSLDPGQSAGSLIGALTGASRYGMGGTASWVTDPITGVLASTGGNVGETSRLIAEMIGATTIDFEMEIVGGGYDDYFAFYIDGVLQVATYGEALHVLQQLPNTGTHLLMWEFTRGTGNAVIRKLSH